MRLKEKLNRIKVFVGTFLAEFFIVGGVFFVSFASYQIDSTLGSYVLGAILFVIGLSLAKTH